VRRSVIVCAAAQNARALATLETGTLKMRILRAKTANLEYEQRCEIEVIYSSSLSVW